MKLRNLGLGVIVVGILFLVGYGAWNVIDLLFNAGDLPLAIRISILIILFGVFIALIALVKERVEDAKKESKPRRKKK